MDRIKLDSSPTPEISFSRVAGSLRVKGWDRSEIRADSDKEDTLSIDLINDKLSVRCESGCLFRAPMESTLLIERVDGDLMVKSIENRIQAERVDGQFLAKNIGPIKIERVKGNFNISHTEGDLECATIDASASIQDVEGTITIENVKGNLTIKGFSAGISASTKGNATLRLETQPEGTYSIKANGNIKCHLSPGTSASISLSSKAQQIKLDAFGTKETINAREHEIKVGEGESTITLEANGYIDLSAPLHEDADWAFEFDFDDDISSMAGDISHVVTEQIEAQMDLLSERINEITANIPGTSAFINDRTKQKLEARRKQLERKLSRVEQQATIKARTKSRRNRPSTYQYTRETTSDPVTDEERQKVLEMLQNQQISVSQAEILLAALEGRESDISSNNPE